MLHIIASPSFSDYSQERLGAKAPQRVEEPDFGFVQPSVTRNVPIQQGQGILRAFSLDGLRRLFGSAPNVRHS